MALGSWTLLLASTLQATWQSFVIAAMTPFYPQAEPWFTQLTTAALPAWTVTQRWWMAGISAGTTMSLWFKVMGGTQHMLRETRPGTAPPAPTLRQRWNTVLMAGITVLLLGLIVTLGFAQLPGHGTAIAAATWWAKGQQLLVQGLRWSLIASTLSLLFGLLYRFSWNRQAKTQPILPGILLATVVSVLLLLVMKRHVVTLDAYPWFFGVISSAALGLASLYGCILGCLMGARFNILVKYHVRNHQAATTPTALPAPPSFESFTIKRRSDRGW